MRTTTSAARGKPLAVALLFLALACASGAVWGEGTLLVEQSLSPAQINVAGMGAKLELASIGITLVGQGPAGRYPVDCMVVIDTSVSAQLADAKAFAYDLVGRLDRADRVGVVAFGETAELVVPLADGNTVMSPVDGTKRAQIAIASLGESAKSALGAGLRLAHEELVRTGRAEAAFVIVLIADGQNSVGPALTVDSILADTTGSHIAAVGIAPILNRALLKGVAEDSGGLFVTDLSSVGAETVVDYLADLPAATDIVITKRVPAGLRFAGSTPAPTGSRTEPDGSATITWRVARVDIGQTVRIDAQFEASVAGNLASDGLSAVAYRDFRGVTQDMALVPLTLSVVMPNRAPVAAFSIEPVAPRASDIVHFVDESWDLDEEDHISAWHWSFGDGTTSDAREPEHQYARGTYQATLSVADKDGTSSAVATRTIVVDYAVPVASFVFRDAATGLELPAPLAGGEVTLDASASRDADGTITAYGWDLDGDGEMDAESSDPTMTTSYAALGEQSVTLWVTDDTGNVGSSTATFVVVTGITVERSIQTHLPGDETIPGATTEVTLTISANASLHGMLVRETLPSGWIFTDLTEQVDALSKPAVKTTSTSAEWAFAEPIVAGSANSKRVIKYMLTLPASATLYTNERTVVALQGYASSSSPRLSDTTLGEDKITVLKFLSIPVAISCWNIETASIDLAVGDRDLGGGRITSEQLEYAISLWTSGTTVPGTDAKIDAAMMQELIAYCETKSSVYDPLP